MGTLQLQHWVSVLCKMLQDLSSEAVAPLTAKLPLETRGRVGDFIRAMFKVGLHMGPCLGFKRTTMYSIKVHKGHVLGVALKGP
eukprot:809444-Pelagomonas_calceolata.AAC.3